MHVMRFIQICRTTTQYVTHTPSHILACIIYTIYWFVSLSLLVSITPPPWLTTMATR